MSAAFATLFEQVDVLAGPTVAYAAPAEDPPVGTPEGDLEGRFTGPYNLAGNPAVSLPCGPIEGDLPAGLQLAAAVGGDELLLSVAKLYEEVSRVRVQDCNWMQLEEYLRDDDRIVLPLGSVEQHAYLSLAVDVILSERVSVEAAEPLGVPVLPALPYGITPYFAAYPGSPTLSADTYRVVVTELLESLYGQGFRRFLLVNGHGGNDPGGEAATEWSAAHDDAQTIWHNWWNAPRTWEVVQSIDADASHASWLENFPWTRLAGVDQPQERKSMADIARMRESDPLEVRRMLGDGSLGGLYERPDEDVLRVWQAGVEEVRDLIENGWSRA